MKTPAEVVRACYAAYETKNRAAIDALLAPEFTFTSPLDDRIDRETYFARCWPNSEHLDRFEIEKLFSQGDEVFVQYQAFPSNGGAPFRNTEFFTLRDGLVTHVDVYFGSETGVAAAEDEIRNVIQSWTAAIRVKDVEGVARHFAPDSVGFYLAPPLQATMPVRQNLMGWFATWQGDIGYEIRDLTIASDGDVAYAHSLNRMTGTKSDGTSIDLWFRETLGLRKLDGHWKIAHEHESVPFAMDGSFKAEVNLKPSA